MIHKVIRRLKRLLLYFVIIAILLFFLFPFYWMIVTSLQERSNLYSKNPNFLPRDVTLENYSTVLVISRRLGSVNVLRALGNSMIVAISVSLICVIMGILTAYAFTRLKFKGANAAFIGIIITQMLPPISLLIPIYVLFRAVHLVNTLSGLVILQVAFFLPISTILLHSYLKSIPKSLEDAARVDGTTRVGAIFKIIVPVSWPGIVTSGIIVFIFSMGSFLDAVTLLTSKRVQTLPIAIFQFISRASIGWGPLSATSIIIVSIPLILVFIFQRFIVAGMVAGAVKE